MAVSFRFQVHNAFPIRVGTKAKLESGQVVDASVFGLDVELQSVGADGLPDGAMSQTYRFIPKGDEEAALLTVGAQVVVTLAAYTDGAGTETDPEPGA